MTSNNPEAVEVIQADRDAACALYREEIGASDEWFIRQIEAGQQDACPWAQAFARHRLQHSSEPTRPGGLGIEHAEAAWNRYAYGITFNGGVRPSKIDFMTGYMAALSPSPDHPEGGE